MLEEGYNPIEAVDTRRKSVLIYSQVFHGLKYASQGLAVFLEDRDPNFFDTLSVDNPLFFSLWREFNHHSSSVALGVAGVAGFKWLFDRKVEGRLGSDFLAVLTTTGVYTFFEKMSENSGATFSIEDVAIACVTGVATVLVDRMLRARNGIT